MVTNFTFWIKTQRERERKKSESSASLCTQIRDRGDCDICTEREGKKKESFLLWLYEESYHVLQNGHKEIWSKTKEKKGLYGFW